MPQMQLGCQTITWGQDRADKQEQIVAAVADAGYQAIEYGSRFLDLDAPEQFAEILERHDIPLIALHTGWRPGDSTLQSTLEDLDRLIAFAEVNRTPFITASGPNGVPTLAANIDQLNTMGERCAEQDITFCYHNHYWEIQDDARGLRAVEEGTDPEVVSFCPDIAWIRKVTSDVTGTLRIIEPRVRLVHFKDYLSDDISIVDDETEFGKGILDFEEAFDYLKMLPVGTLWVIAEQWCSTEGLEPEESIRYNREFLQRFVE